MRRLTVTLTMLAAATITAALPSPAAGQGAQSPPADEELVAESDEASDTTPYLTLDPAHAPWRGSQLQVRTDVAVTSFDPGADLTYNPQAGLAFSGRLRWWLLDALYVQASLGLNRELTKSDSTTYAGETLLGDLAFRVSSPGLLTIPWLDIDISPSIDLQLPTSKASAARTMLASVNVGLAISRDFAWLEGLSLAYELQAARRFHAYTDGPVRVTVPNGATGYYEDIGFGGRPVENRLANDQGEYDSQMTMNAGSYYDKMYASMLFTESVDNYISSSRDDFVDARYRAVSLADLFPDGYRRLLGNALTGDDFIKGPRVMANSAGNPLLDGDGYPASPIGWTTWWGPEPETCFPSNGTRVCKSYGGLGVTEDDLDAQSNGNVAVLDPQIGWEQQKFLIAWTMLYLPENQQQEWIDSLRVWELGVDADPGFENRIEFHNPSGKIYVAKTAGRETIFGKSVQRGIAARVLEYANELLEQSYETTPGPDLDGDGSADWRVPVIDAGTGRVHVLYDTSISGIDEESLVYTNGLPGCNASSNEDCTCGSNRACTALEQYVEVPFFLRQALSTYGLAHPTPKGIY